MKDICTKRSCTGLMVLVITLFVVFATGCGSTPKMSVTERYDSTGTIVVERTTSAEGDAGIIVAGTESRKVELELAMAVKDMDSHAQVAAFSRDTFGQVQPVKDLYGYKARVAEAWKSGMLGAGGIALGWKGFDTIGKFAGVGATTYNLNGEFNQSQGGATGEGGSLSGGHNIFSIGENFVATDNANVPSDIDKYLPGFSGTFNDQDDVNVDSGIRLW